MNVIGTQLRDPCTLINYIYHPTLEQRLYGHLYNTMLDEVLYCFLCTYVTIKVTILSAQPLIPPKRLYAQKVQACFDMY